MERKKILSITVLAVSVTFILIVLGIRGGVFQSSLVGDSATGSGELSINFGSGTSFKEFGSDEERNLIYALLINGNDQQGMYFPRVYKVANGETGEVALAFKSKEFIAIEKKLSLQIKLPSKGISYVGKDVVQTEDYTATAVVNNESGILTLDIQPLGGIPLLLDKDVEPLLLLPFKVSVENATSVNELRLQIVSAVHTMFNDTEVAVPHFDAEGEIHISGTSTGTGNTLPTPTNKPFTGELTPPKRGTLTAPGLNAVPEITQDKTLLAPASVNAQSGSPIYVYVTAKDKDGLKDMDRVTLDLSPLGLAKENKLLEMNRTDTYVEYMTNFALPNGVQASAVPYVLTYKVYDKENHTVSGSLGLMVNQGTKKVEVDLNHDGIVDIKDMTLYINAYQQAQAQ